MEAFGWLDEITPPASRPLINLSQAAPNDPPPEPLREALAQAALNDPSAHFYGPVLGNAPLRAEIAQRWSGLYGGEITPSDVAITAGCNQAFCAATTIAAEPGDEVILPTPWYFNHKMWLDMAGVKAVPLPVGPDMLPSPEGARALITPKTKAIVLVTPNNPTGAEYPPSLVESFADLARAHGLALILDETYRDFAAQPRHQLFAGNWRGTVIHLYSFSKIFRLTGHRVGALIADQTQIAEAEKWFDTVTICPPQLGQIAALYGLQHMQDWAMSQADEIRARRASVQAGFQKTDFRLLSAGAYFAYFEHNWPGGSDALAKALIREAGLLMLPGRMFAPKDDPRAQNQMRMAFANVDADGLSEVFARLTALS